ncbi:MAG: shikimate kinase [Candidatus Omnitrophica bacterium]|nr:shikimate kinase [Candidatus Omnitrophota bacterium]
MPKNIVLVGFMGTGKSVVGKKLAQQLKYGFVDTDEIIQAECRRPIRKIFAEEGESRFRQMEREVIERAAAKDHQVIATGGGAIIDDQNFQALKRNGWIVWLKAEPDVILQRVGDAASRPLLDIEDPKSQIERLLNLRRAAYSKADAAVETSRRNIDEVVQEIVKLVFPA